MTIILPGTELSVRIHDVEFITADEDMMEALLGRTLLKAIGFDLNKHLLMVGNRIERKSETELKSGMVSVSATFFTGMSYQDPDDDP